MASSPSDNIFITGYSCGGNSTGAVAQALARTGRTVYLAVIQPSVWCGLSYMNTTSNVRLAQDTYGNALQTTNQMNSFAGGFQGIVPLGPQRPTSSIYTTWQSITGANGIGSYPDVYGNIRYLVLDGTGGAAKYAHSNHVFASFGRNITTSDFATLSWSYVAGSNVALMDINTVQLMFPGLVIG